MKQCILIMFSVFCMSACSVFESSAPELAREKDKDASFVHGNKQWYCEAKTQDQWRCLNLSKGAKEPSSPAPIPVSTPAPLTKPETTKPKIIHILDYPANYHTVQLLAAREQKTILEFQQQYPQLNVQTVAIERRNRPMYLLIYGVYETHDAAELAVNSIEPPLKSTPWIRALGALQEELRATAL